MSGKRRRGSNRPSPSGGGRLVRLDHPMMDGIRAQVQAIFQEAAFELAVNGYVRDSRANPLWTCHRVLRRVAGTASVEAQRQLVALQAGIYRTARALEADLFQTREMGRIEGRVRSPEEHA